MTLRAIGRISRREALGLALGAAALGSCPALAATYPTKPVSIIVGFAAGGQNDVAARILADRLSQKLGKPFIVENRPGASGNIATEAVARAAPDGHTLMFVATSLIYNATLFPDFSINPSDNLVGVSKISTYPLYLVATPSMPDTVAEIIAGAKAKPGELNYAISGFGTSTHIAAEFFAGQAGIELTAIPYKGGSEAVTATVAGETQLHFGGTAVLPLVESGKLKIVAVTSKERMAKFPNTPTIGETLAGFAFDSWNGVFAPAGTPVEILEVLNAALTEALQSPKVVEAFHKVDLYPDPTSVAEFNRFYREEQKSWGEVIAKAGITLK